MSSTATTPLDQQGIAQDPYALQSGHDSIGPFIAVLIVIVVLGVLSGMVGRLCSGRSIMGYGQYDIERWAETKCSTCIDGTINIPPPARGGAGESSTPVSFPAQTHQETKQDQSPPQNPPANAVDS